MNAVQTKVTALSVLSLIGAWIANQLGGWDTSLMVLLCMMGIDYATGILLAVIWKKSPKTETGGLSSNASFKGLVRKFIIILLVWVAALVDKYTGSQAVKDAVCMFFIANEGISIIENTALMGVPYPKFVKKILEALKAQAEGSGTDETK